MSVEAHEIIPMLSPSHRAGSESIPRRPDAR